MFSFYHSLRSFILNQESHPDQDNIIMETDTLIEIYHQYNTKKITNTTAIEKTTISLQKIRKLRNPKKHTGSYQKLINEIQQKMKEYLTDIIIDDINAESICNEEYKKIINHHRRDLYILDHKGEKEIKNLIKKNQNSIINSYQGNRHIQRSLSQKEHQDLLIAYPRLQLYKDILPKRVNHNAILGVGTKAIIIDNKNGTVTKIPLHQKDEKYLKYEVNLHNRVVAATERGKKTFVNITFEHDHAIVYKPNSKEIWYTHTYNNHLKQYVRNKKRKRSKRSTRNSEKGKYHCINELIQPPKIHGYHHINGHEYFIMDKIKGNTTLNLLYIQEIYKGDELPLPERIGDMNDYQLEKYLSEKTGKSLKTIQEELLQFINIRRIKNGKEAKKHIVDISFLNILEILFDKQPMHHFWTKLASKYYVEEEKLHHPDPHGGNEMIGHQKKNKIHPIDYDIISNLDKAGNIEDQSIKDLFEGITLPIPTSP